MAGVVEAVVDEAVVPVVETFFFELPPLVRKIPTIARMTATATAGSTLVSRRLRRWAR